MSHEKTEGIVLKSLPFQDSKKIITLFSLDFGIITLITKKISSKNVSLIQLLTPLSIGEYAFRKGKSDLYSLLDGSLIDTHSKYRDSYDKIVVGANLIRSVSKTQMHGNSAPKLFILLKRYLQKLPEVKKPQNLLCSFYLKLLLHDGIVIPLQNCSKCKQAASCLFYGESLCITCAPEHSLRFTTEEWQTLYALTYTTKFSLLDGLDIAETLRKKIEILFSNI